MTARALDVPLAIVRRVNRVTEGTVVTTNYVSGSAKRIETMSLSRRALSPGMKVVIIDDFMKAGGSARGLVDLVAEFGAEVAGDRGVGGDRGAAPEIGRGVPLPCRPRDGRRGERVVSR